MEKFPTSFNESKNFLANFFIIKINFNNNFPHFLFKLYIIPYFKFILRDLTFFSLIIRNLSLKNHFLLEYIHILIYKLINYFHFLIYYIFLIMNANVLPKNHPQFF